MLVLGCKTTGTGKPCPRDARYFTDTKSMEKTPEYAHALAVTFPMVDGQCRPGEDADDEHAQCLVFERVDALEGHCFGERHR